MQYTGEGKGELARQGGGSSLSNKKGARVGEWGSSCCSEDGVHQADRFELAERCEGAKGGGEGAPVVGLMQVNSAHAEAEAAVGYFWKRKIYCLTTLQSSQTRILLWL